MAALRGMSQWIASRYNMLKLLLIFGVIVARHFTCVTGQITIYASTATPNTFTGTFSIVKTGISDVSYDNIILGNYTNGDTVNISSFGYNQDLSLVVHYECCFTSVVLSYLSSTPDSFVQNEMNPPYALKGNSGSNFNAVSDLKTIGTKQIIVDGYKDLMKIASLNLTFTIIKSTENPIATLPAPTPAPVPQAPVPAALCTVPEFVTDSSWESYTAKDGSHVAESQGGFIGTDLIIFGGFSGWWYGATNKTYSYNTITDIWKEVDSIPIPNGITHMGHVIVGNKLYGCGGYMGGVPDLPATSQCFVYTHGNASGSQWSSIPNLPVKRSGGALLHDKARNSLIFAAGTDAHIENQPDTKTVWELFLSRQYRGWRPRSAIPYGANHVGGTTVLYNGVETHYVLGGQESLNEGFGNKDSLYAYNAARSQWTQKASMPEATGHISSSTIPYKNCGLLIIGGAHNCACKTSKIYYYSIGSDSWTLIGNLPQDINTPVCSILDDWLYCQSGTFGPFSWRRKIV